MRNVHRVKVWLSHGIPTVESLAKVLPSPWTVARVIDADDGKSKWALCTAPESAGVKEPLEKSLFEALGNADFEWLEESNEKISAKREKAALDKIAVGIRNRKKD